MKCPHCLVAFHPSPTYQPQLGKGKDIEYSIESFICPDCQGLVAFLRVQKKDESMEKHMVWPKGTARPACPSQVPDDIAEDYNEACIVLVDSPKASAALSRRALQHLLRDAAGVKKGDLVNEIQEVLNSGKLPSHIAGSIDAIRNIGNFSAHPQKSQSTGEILPVEPHEAEWNLTVLEELFDFYQVQPDILQKRRDALNQKLAEAGKPPMK